jgi:hypothetical protein
MAPDGDEAFDDGSLVVQWDAQERVGLAAGMIAENQTADHPLIVAPVASIDCSQAEFYGVVAEAIRWFSTLEVAPLG